MLKFLKKYDKSISIGVLIISILLSVATLFIPGPTMIATFIVGSMLTPVLVSLVAGLGSAFGESTGYATGYASLAIISPRERKSTWYQRVFHWMQKHPFFTIFILDAIPNPLNDIAGLIAGRNKYPFLKFLVASFLGKTIRFSLSTYLGFAFGDYLPRK